MTITPSAPHLTTEIHRPPTTAEGNDHILRNLGITLGASAIVLAGLAGAQYLSNQSASTGTAPVTAVQAFDAYAPGGSVYAQQVPTVTTALEAYAPGGSVYGQQVPSLASAGLEAYAPGGSVYAQQVPLR
jgi:hypothetical protein